MPLTNSAMVPLGAALPAFSLPNVVSGRTVTSAALDPEKPVLVLFICAHCPFTRHIAPAIREVARHYGDRVNLVAISPNDITQVPDDSPDGLRRLAKEIGWTASFCYDESQSVAQAFGAVCTPECFLYDRGRKLVYRGEIDPSRPAGGLKSLIAKTPTGAPVRAALDALLGSGTIDPSQRPGSGCNIKWRAAGRAAAANI